MKKPKKIQKRQDNSEQKQKKNIKDKNGVTWSKEMLLRNFSKEGSFCNSQKF